VENIDLAEAIRRASAGDTDAIVDVISRYRQLIYSHSYINGEIDEDLKQFILLCFLKKLTKFTIK